jgi:hypothetical protein
MQYADRGLRASPAAWRARASIAASSTSPAGTSQLPPTQATDGSASQSGAVSSVMPPVGQKRTPPNTALNDFSAGSPPDAVAGKNFIRVMPKSSARMMSPALATPGSSGTPDPAAASPTAAVRPGLTTNCDPASSAESNWRGLSTVPAPTIAPSTPLIARMASSAAGVRSVTSRTLRPPATSARATGTASSTRSMTSTGMTGEASRMRSMSDKAWLLCCGEGGE